MDSSRTQWFSRIPLHKSQPELHIFAQTTSTHPRARVLPSWDPRHFVGGPRGGVGKERNQCKTSPQDFRKIWILMDCWRKVNEEEAILAASLHFPIQNTRQNTRNFVWEASQNTRNTSTRGGLYYLLFARKWSVRLSSGTRHPKSR